MILTILVLLLLLCLSVFIGVYISVTGEPVVYTESVFKIDYIYDESVPEYIREICEISGRRWSVLMLSSPEHVVTLSGSMCGYVFTENREIEGLLIYVVVRPIDGVSGVLASAGPCVVDMNYIPRYGVIYIDSSDVEFLSSSGLFEDLLVHEIGHVLGIGSLWQNGVTYMESEEGSYVYLLRWGNEYADGGVAYVESMGGVGTRGTHWSELVYDREIMTGWIESSRPMPLLPLTIGALRDLGYDVVSPSSYRRYLRSTMNSGVVYNLKNCTIYFDIQQV